MNEFDERIEKANTICILGHDNIDGDCVGSILATYNYIKNKFNDKKVVAYFEDEKKQFSILPNHDKAKTCTNDATIYDLAIILDCGKEDRFKTFESYYTNAKSSINIDHHENNTINVDMKICNPKSIATCEILYDLFDKKYIDINVATCLYIGIVTDSGSFRYKSTTKRTYEIAGELISYGFNFTKLLDTIIYDNTFNQRKTQALVFDRLKLLCKGKISYSYITEDEMSMLNVDKQDLSNMIVYLREIENIWLAAFAYPVGKDIYKFSIRSKIDSIDVAKFCSMHDGGGHKLAAGCLYYGNIEVITKKFTDDINNFINEYNINIDDI